MSGRRSLAAKTAGAPDVTLRRMLPALAIVLAALLAHGPAAEAADDGAKSSAWEFDVMPYAWIPGTFGTLEIAGRTSQVEATVLDLLKIVTSGNGMAAGGYFAARYDRWHGFVDAFGGYLEESVRETVPTRFCTPTIAATLEVRPVIVDFGVGYRLGQWAVPERQRPITLGAYAGMRYTQLGSKVRASIGVDDVTRASANVSATFRWADPMIGVNWELPLLQTLALDFRSDIGGFGVSSKLIWGIVTDLRYQLPWTFLSTQPWIALGYRVVAFDHDFSGASSADLQFRGPMSGLGFTF